MEECSSELDLLYHGRAMAAPSAGSWSKKHAAMRDRARGVTSSFAHMCSVTTSHIQLDMSKNWLWQIQVPMHGQENGWIVNQALCGMLELCMTKLKSTASTTTAHSQEPGGLSMKSQTGLDVTVFVGKRKVNYT